MPIKENELNVIVQNSIVNRTLGRTSSLSEAVQVIHIPTGTRAESFSLSTVMANKVRCIENMEAMLKAIPREPIPVGAGYSRMACAECGTFLEEFYLFCPHCGQAILR